MSLVHDSQELYGENLYVASRTPLPNDKKGSCVEAVDSWYDEISKYDYDNPGFDLDTGK
jgi:hypothetical protein